jgi:hypothetical protein
MKYILGSLFLMILLFSCRPYKVSESVVGIDHSVYSKISKKYSVKNITDLPQRIYNSDLLKYGCFTLDSSCFRKSKGEVYLFIDGAYDKTKRCGYIVYSCFKSDSTITNSCDVFNINSENQINSNQYVDIPSDINTWQKIQPYLLTSDMMMFGMRSTRTKKKCFCN